MLLAVALLAGTVAAQAAPSSVQLDELTWTEVRDAVKTGTSTEGHAVMPPAIVGGVTMGVGPEGVMPSGSFLLARLLN